MRLLSAGVYFVFVGLSCLPEYPKKLEKTHELHTLKDDLNRIEDDPQMYKIHRSFLQISLVVIN